MLSHKIQIIALIALVCAMSQTSRADHHVGGLSDEHDANEPTIKSMIDGLRPEIERQAMRKINKVEPISYRKQIVAGVNYYVKAMITDTEGKTSPFHIRIYKHFRNEPELIAMKAVPDLHKPLEYFQ